MNALCGARQRCAAGLAFGVTALVMPATAAVIEFRLAAGQSFERRWAVEPGGVVEMCGPLRGGQVVVWRFDAGGRLDFNIHFHVDDQVSTAARHDGARSASGRLVVAVDQDYCWMWTNRSDRKVSARAPARRAPRGFAMNRSARLLTWLPALLALGSGIWWRDCVLLTSAGLFALVGFRRRMDRDSPLNPLVAGLRCLNAGVGAMLAGAALVLMLAGAWLDWWQPANDSPGVAAAVLLLLFALLRAQPVSQAQQPRRQATDSGTESLLLAAGLATLVLEGLGVRLICCAGAATAAAYLAWSGWHLLHDDARFMLRAAE